MISALVVRFHSECLLAYIFQRHLYRKDLGVYFPKLVRLYLARSFIRSVYIKPSQNSVGVALTLQ